MSIVKAIAIVQKRKLAYTVIMQGSLAMEERTRPQNPANNSIIITSLHSIAESYILIHRKVYVILTPLLLAL